MSSLAANWLARLRGGSRTDPVTTTGRSVPQPEPESKLPVYPPPRDVWPRFTPEQLLEPHAQIIAAIRHSIGLPPEQFDALVPPVLSRFAAFVHLLPASESHHHCGPGGLLHHSLEVAQFSVHFAEDSVFGIETPPVVRKKIDVRSRIAAMLAGLLHDVGKALTDVIVTSPDGAITWNGHVESIYDFLLRHDLQYYDIQFRSNRHRRHEARGATVAERIIGPQMNAYLSDDTPGVIEELYDVLVDPKAANNIFSKHVLGADASSVTRDMKRQRNKIGGNAKSGMGLAMRYLSAIQGALRDGAVVANEPGGIVWATSEGVFLRFPDGIRFAIGQMQANGESGFPQTNNEILDLLAENGVIQVCPLPGGGERHAWEVELTVSASGQTTLQRMNALRMERDEHLFGSAKIPAPIPARIIPPVPTNVVPMARVAAADTAVEEPGSLQVKPGASVEDMVDASRRGNTTRMWTLEDAKAWLDAQPRAATYLYAIGEGYARRDPHYLATVRNDLPRVHILYPSVFNSMQHAGIRELLQKAGWLVPNDDNPNVWVIHAPWPGEQGNNPQLVMTDEASAALRALFAQDLPLLETAPVAPPPVAASQSLSEEDALYLKWRMHQRLTKRYTRVQGGIVNLHDGPIRNQLTEVAKLIGMPMQDMQNILAAEPKPLLQFQVDSGTLARLRVLGTFDPATIKEPPGVLDRNPSWQVI